MQSARFLCRLAILFVATLVFDDAANAYSDDAVKDANDLLKMTLDRYHVGEVTSADVALARYYVIEMQYKAGQISRGAFCSSAKLNLDAVAKEFEESEGQAGQKKAWEDEIAGMAASQSKCDQAAASAARLMFGVKTLDHSDAALKEAQEFADATAERYRDGEVTKSDVERAQYDLLEIKYAANQIPRSTYCTQAPPALQGIANSVEEEARVGQRALEEVIGAKRKMYEVTALCRA
jgi:hypothetical protein